MKSKFLTTVRYIILVGPPLWTTACHQLDCTSAYLHIFPMFNNCTSRQISGLGQFVERLGKGHSPQKVGWIVPWFHRCICWGLRHRTMSWMEELSFLGLNMGNKGKWRASPVGSLRELILGYYKNSCKVSSCHWFQVRSRLQTNYLGSYHFYETELCISAVFSTGW